MGLVQTSRRIEEVRMSEIEPQVRAKGYTDEQLKGCIAEYEDINVWHSHAGKIKLGELTVDRVCDGLP
jgi:hypothetical protein